MPLWLIIVLVVLVVLVVGGIIARNRQLASTRPAFERALAQVDRDPARVLVGEPGGQVVGRAYLDPAEQALHVGGGDPLGTVLLGHHRPVQQPDGEHVRQRVVGRLPRAGVPLLAVARDDLVEWGRAPTRGLNAALDFKARQTLDDLYQLAVGRAARIAELVDRMVVSEPVQAHQLAGALAAAHQERSRVHLPGRHAARPGGRHEGAHARSDHEAGNEPSLLERPEDADVREPLEAPAAQHQCHPASGHRLPEYRRGG